MTVIFEGDCSYLTHSPKVVVQIRPRGVLVASAMGYKSMVLQLPLWSIDFSAAAAFISCSTGTRSCHRLQRYVLVAGCFLQRHRSGDPGCPSWRQSAYRGCSCLPLCCQ